jgi:hypothetical protein
LSLVTLNHVTLTHQVAVRAEALAAGQLLREFELARCRADARVAALLGQRAAMFAAATGWVCRQACSRLTSATSRRECARPRPTAGEQPA